MPFVALAGLLLLVNLFLPTALRAAVDRDAFGAPICAGHVGEGEGMPARCNKCCPAVLAALPAVSSADRTEAARVEAAPLPMLSPAPRRAGLALPAPARGPPSDV